MILLGYIDVRPFLFVGGLPLFIGLSLFICWQTKTKFKKANVALISALLFTGLFTLLWTGIGPFIDEKETREQPGGEPSPDQRGGSHAAKV